MRIGLDVLSTGVQPSQLAQRTAISEYGLFLPLSTVIIMTRVAWRAWWRTAAAAVTALDYLAHVDVHIDVSTDAANADIHALECGSSSVSQFAERLGQKGEG
jgi:hypothetical protein